MADLFFYCVVIMNDMDKFVVPIFTLSFIDLLLMLLLPGSQFEPAKFLYFAY